MSDRSRRRCVKAESRAAAGRKASKITPPYRVLITGSTKGERSIIHAPLLYLRPWLHAGVGLALAEDFLRMGDSVLVSSRSDERVQEAVSELAKEHGADRVKVLSTQSLSFGIID